MEDYLAGEEGEVGGGGGGSSQWRESSVWGQHCGRRGEHYVGTFIHSRAQSHDTNLPSAAAKSCLLS